MNDKTINFSMVASILASAFWSFFLVGNFMGLGMFIFTNLLLCVFLTTIAYEKGIDTVKKPEVVFLSLVTLLCSLNFIIFDSTLFKTFNIFILPIVFVLIYMFSTNGNNWLKNIVRGFLTFFLSFEMFDQLVKKLSAKSTGKFKNLVSVFIGILVVTFILLIVFPLLINSDIVFKSMIRNFTDNFFKNFNWSEIVFRIIFFVFATFYMFGFILENFKKRKTETEKEEKEKKIFNNISVITFLIPLNIIYVIFSYVQIKYLFLNMGQLPKALTYSDYARQGFFQLLAISIINYIIILVINNRVKRNVVINFFIGILIASDFIMIASSFYRMNLYQMTYGYSRLRILVYIVLILEIVLTILLIYTLFKKNFKLFKWTIIVSLVFYTGSCLLPIDAIIAKNNVDMLLNGQIQIEEFDYDYFYQISNDANRQLLRITKSDNSDDEWTELKRKINEKIRCANIYIDDRTLLEYNILNIWRIKEK